MPSSDDRASLHAWAFLAWMLAAFGAVLRWWAGAGLTGAAGLLPYAAYRIGWWAGPALAGLGALAAVGLHLQALFADKDAPMPDPTVPPTLPPPSGSVDVIELLRAHIPEAHAVALQQAHLAGQLQQAVADFAAQPALGAALAAARDAIARALAIATSPDVATALAMLPEPARTVANDALVGLRALRGVLGAFAPNPPAP